MMTPDAKKLLASTIQSLRARLLVDLHDATESAWQLAIPRARDASLTEAGRARRARFDGWIDEQLRADPKLDRTTARADVEKTAAYTLLNRLVLLRLLEAGRHSTAQVVTGGWRSGGYQAFRELNPALVLDDPSEGYAWLLQMLFEDLSAELPGLFGAGIADLVPVPVPTLRHVVEALDDPALASCWTDDMTLGWVYQYWNDPEREAIDTKLNAGGKVARREIASKTQMFTERYMVDWLLQNSLGPMWLAMCQKHGWTADAVRDGTLERLEARRVEWRRRRDAGEVSLTELMPISPGMEERWAYYVPQPIPADAVEKAPKTLWDLRVLDPAVGSGHFLVVAFDLLVALHEEEARHRSASSVGFVAPSRRAIVERILEHNLSGIDLDPRAVQIAAAALWLKARQTCKEARPKRLNLVAAALKIGSLPDDDAALVELRRSVQEETGIPALLTDTVIHALRGADHIGSLLRVDDAVEEALKAQETALSRAGAPVQVPLFGVVPEPIRITISKEEARVTVLDRLDTFLSRRTRGDDLGLRLRGEQLAAGVRFVRLVRAGSYDLVVGNPPYQGTAKMEDAAYVQRSYPLGKVDLYAAFWERALEFVREGGVSALVTMRNWMFVKQYEGLRTWLLESCDLRAIGDLSWGAFEHMRDNPVVMAVVRRDPPARGGTVAIAPTDPQERIRTSEELERKRAGALAGVGRREFHVQELTAVGMSPVLYWWSEEDRSRYTKSVKVGDLGGCIEGLGTRNDTRYLRRWHEVRTADIFVEMCFVRPPGDPPWVPFIAGAAGTSWVEPLEQVVTWRHRGAEISMYALSRFGRGASKYFTRGVAVTTTGTGFSGRLHRFSSVFGDKGRSVFGIDPVNLVCSLARSSTARMASEFNPGLDFRNYDVERLPVVSSDDDVQVVLFIEAAFTLHESHREPSVEFKHPGPSPWIAAQAWAQVAVDRPADAPLPDYSEVLDPEPPTDHLSYALGCALGRFGRNSEGILDPATHDLSDHGPSGTLSSGLLFLDGTLDAEAPRDSLGQPPAAYLHHVWHEQGAAIAPGSSLRDYLRTDFFSEVHRQMYENRPIHWPLSSKKKTFVAWVTIHRWTDRTLRDLLADHLYPTQTRLIGEVADLRATRDGADKAAAKNAEKRLGKVKPALDELAEFITNVEQCAERGPPNDPTYKREVDARYAPDLDDGVMINAAALHPLLAPQWKDPAKWWKELAAPSEKKHLDWAHLAMRYWPTRVDARCQTDPSLGVAHGCFWRYHPARAWAWELRLQDEIGPEHRIVEAPYRGDDGDVGHRAAYLRDHAIEALATVETEALRRRRKKKAAQAELVLLEAGLWAGEPRACWDLELRVIEKQGAEFRLRAPDDAAREGLIAENPALVEDRKRRLEKAQVGLGFGATEPDEDADDSGETEESK